VNDLQLERLQEERKIEFYRGLNPNTVEWIVDFDERPEDFQMIGCLNLGPVGFHPAGTLLIFSNEFHHRDGGGYWVKYRANRIVDRDPRWDDQCRQRIKDNERLGRMWKEAMTTSPSSAEPEPWAAETWLLASWLAAALCVACIFGFVKYLQMGGG
jgi:hypothetical protein